MAVFKSQLPVAMQPLHKHLIILLRPDPRPCIYFLMRAGALLYIGRSKNVWRRVMEHRRGKIFDADIYILPMAAEDLSGMEVDLIHELQPPLNLNHADTSTQRASPIRERCDPEPFPTGCMARGFDPEMCDCDSEFDCDCMDCDCQACELEAVDPERWERIYLLGTERLPEGKPLLPEEWDGIAEECRRVFASPAYKPDDREQEFHQ